MTDAAPSTSAPDGVHGPDPAVVDDIEPAHARSGSTPCSARPAPRRASARSPPSPSAPARWRRPCARTSTWATAADRTVVVKYGRADVESTMAAMAYAKEVAFYAELGDRWRPARPTACTRPSPRAPRGSCSCSRTWPTPARATRSPGAPSPTPRPRWSTSPGCTGPPGATRRWPRRPWLGGDTDARHHRRLHGAGHRRGRRLRSPSGSRAELDPVEADVLAASRELLPRVDVRAGRALRRRARRLPPRQPAVPRRRPGPGGGRRLADRGPRPARAATSPTSSSTCLTVDDRRAPRARPRRRPTTGRSPTTTSPATAPTHCWDDYVDGMLHGPLIILLGRLTAGVTERGDEMFRVMWRRASAAIDDLGTLDTVRARLDGPAA